MVSDNVLAGKVLDAAKSLNEAIATAVYYELEVSVDVDEIHNLNRQHVPNLRVTLRRVIKPSQD